MRQFCACNGYNIVETFFRLKTLLEFKELIFNLREKIILNIFFLISLAHLRFNKLFMAHG